MASNSSDRRDHWDSVYRSKQAHELSWFQTSPDLSLKLIRRTGISRTAPILDVGGGASVLVDRLLDDGFTDIAVLDVAANALAQTKARLRARADAVDWIVADITNWTSPKQVEIWHDRAVFHFLTRPEDQAAYARTLDAALAPGGWVIIGGFAPGGPVKCSGLAIVQHDAASLGAVLGSNFALAEVHGEIHETPWGADQAFRHHIFRKVAAAR